MSGKFLPSGTVIDSRFRLEQPIGAGGFSIVYRALHLVMDRPVAIKIFDPTDEPHSDPAVRRRRMARFEREARLVSRLSHPNTVTIFDFGSDLDGKLFLVMEFIDGRTLKTELKDHGRLPRDRAITFFLQLLGSLAEAHSLGMLHRDLKPANIMIAENFKGEEIIKVLDFGIARMVGDPQRELSASGRPLFLGTPRFAAPEQLTGKELTFATDVFGVGALFWLCLIGRPLMKGATLTECIRVAMNPHPFRVPEDSGLDLELVALLERSVAKDPAHRFANAAEMLDALQRISGLGTDDLPEIRPATLSPRGEIFDPNLTDATDTRNVFLTPHTARLPPTSRQRPRPSPDPSPSLQVASSPDDVPIELDERALRPPRPTSPRPARDPRPRFLPSNVAVGIGFLLIVTVSFVLSRIAIPRTDHDLVEDLPDNVAVAPLPPASPFTIDGITSALFSTDWRLAATRDPVELQRFTYHSFSLRRGDALIDVTLYETDGPRTLQEITESIAYPAREIVLGHIAVRLQPRDTFDDEPILELIALLADYRALVLAQISSH
jgi:eukaryotic-like serine/threonine-protein kinase